MSNSSLPPSPQIAQSVVVYFSNAPPLSKGQLRITGPTLTATTVYRVNATFVDKGKLIVSIFAAESINHLTAGCFGLTIHTRRVECFAIGCF